jgi:hypothetical protein
MHSIITPEAVDSGKKMLFAKWIDCSRVLVAVSPAAERVCMLRDTALINGIKKQGDVGKSQGECVGGAQWLQMLHDGWHPPIPNYKIVFSKGTFNGICAYYNIHMDPDLGLGYAALWHIACGCKACKEQLGRPWLPRANVFEQMKYAQNNECVLQPSYKGANNWKICQLLPVTEDNEKGAQDSILCVLIAMDAWMLLMVWEGEAGAVGTTDKAAMGYYLVKWLSKPYALQSDSEGMSWLIVAGAMVVDVVF